MPIPTNKVFKAPPQGEIATHLPRGKMRWPSTSYEASPIRAKKRTKRSKNPNFAGSPEDFAFRLRSER